MLTVLCCGCRCCERACLTAAATHQHALQPSQRAAADHAARLLASFYIVPIFFCELFGCLREVFIFCRSAGDPVNEAIERLPKLQELDPQQFSGALAASVDFAPRIRPANDSPRIRSMGHVQAAAPVHLLPAALPERYHPVPHSSCLALRIPTSAAVTCTAMPDVGAPAPSAAAALRGCYGRRACLGHPGRFRHPPGPRFAAAFPLPGFSWLPPVAAVPDAPTDWVRRFSGAPSCGGPLLRAAAVCTQAYTRWRTLWRWHVRWSRVRSRPSHAAPLAGCMNHCCGQVCCLIRLGAQLAHSGLGLPRAHAALVQQDISGGVALLQRPLV